MLLFGTTACELPGKRARKGPNPYISIAHVHSLFGLPNVVDSPCRNRGPHWPLLQTCRPLLCFFTGKSEVWASRW